MKQIEKFMLPQHTNNLYEKEAISSIALTREVADKINELVDAYNEVSAGNLEKYQELEGTVRKGVLFMKDNLINSIHDLFSILYANGDLKDIITDATLGELVKVVNATSGIVNVKSFGATGDGIKDDYEALQEAIEFAEENGGYLYIPAGQYRYRGTLRISKSIRIMGDKGAIQYGGTYLLHDSESDVPAIHVETDGDYIYNFFMENIAVKNNTHDFLESLATTKTGLQLVNVSESEIKNCSFYGFNIGIRMKGVTITNFDKCWVYYNKYGIWTARKGLDGETTQNRLVKFHAMNIYRNGVGVVLGGEQLSFNNCHMENQENSMFLFDNKYSLDCKFLDINGCNIVNEFTGIPFMVISPSENKTSKILYTNIMNTQMQLTNVDYAIKKEKTSSDESYIINLEDVIAMGVDDSLVGGTNVQTVVINQKGQVRCVAGFDGSGEVKPICKSPVKLIGHDVDTAGRTKVNGVLQFTGRDDVTSHQIGDVWLAGDVLRFNNGEDNTFISTHKWCTSANTPDNDYEGQMVYDGTVNAPRYYNHRTNTWTDSLPKLSSKPTTGTWAKGDIVINNNPTGNGNVGWICVEGGSPGIWRKFGTVGTE